MPKPTIAIFAPDSADIDKATVVAKQLNLPYRELNQAYDFLLLVTSEYIGIQPCHAQITTKPLHVDFLSAKLQYRQHQASLRKEALARAIGMKPGNNPYIVDATAGLARDSFILASLGFEITLLERSPILHLLVMDAIQRSATDSMIATITHRLHLVHTDAITWLLEKKSSNQSPQIIYLDPMFPERRKTAEVKKEMRILQDLLGEDNDANQLLITALTCATQRVVVKRPRLAPPLAGHTPAFQLVGKSARFDIYITR
ncbi:MAG: hypothetical protein A3E84_02010 [Gammaproteobacteria bacterium RIFCSPHIGHO2_12_FULL_42_13]|nr:MAG: hypothetical protein A3E84_02010 [Gammaproteobacteria bacterium RIFCSPHIGHO2_12_FULL_42_13]